MNYIYDTILDPILALAYLAAGAAGVQAAKFSMILSGFVLSCNVAESLFVTVTTFLFRAL